MVMRRRSLRSTPCREEGSGGGGALRREGEEASGGGGALRREGALTRSAVCRSRGFKASCKAPAAPSPNLNRSISSEDESSDDEPEVTDAGGDGHGTGDPMTYMPKKFHGCFSSHQVGKLLSRFCGYKKDIVRSIGLGGLLSMKPKMQHSRHLVFWMLRNLDTRRMRLTLPGHTEIELTEESVERVMGIRASGIPVCDGGKYLGKLVKEYLSKIFRTVDAKMLPTVRDAKRILLRDYGIDMTHRQKEVFTIALAAYCCAYMLGPRERAAKVPHGLWQFISNADNVRQCNWAAYVLGVIKQFAMQIQSNLIMEPSSIRLGGCWLYLELMYLDTVDLGPYNVPLDVTPRVLAYNKCNVKDLISMDQISRTRFGSRPKRNEGMGSGGAVRGDSVGPEKRTEPVHGRDKEEVIEKIKQELSHVLEDLSESCEKMHEENKKMYQAQEANIDNMFYEIRNSVTERVENMVKYMSTGSSNDEHVVDPDGCNVTSRSMGNGKSASKQRVDSDLQHNSEEAGCSKRAGEHGEQDIDAESKRNRMSMHDARRQDIEASAKSCAEKNGTMGNDEMQTSFGLDEQEKVNSEQEEPVFDSTPISTCRNRDQPFFDQTPMSTGGAPNVQLFDSTPAALVQESAKNIRREYGGDVGGNKKVASTSEMNNTTGRKSVTSGELKKGRIKMCGKKGQKRDNVENVEVAELNKMGIAKKVCTHRNMLERPTYLFSDEGNNDKGQTNSDGWNNPISSGKHVKGQIKKTTGSHLSTKKFPPSPFELKLQLPGKLRQVAYDKYTAIMSKKGSELQRVWVKLEGPKVIEITGGQLQSSFKEHGFISSLVFSAVVHLLQEEETAMYIKHSSKHHQWRHFMAPEFSDLVLGSEDIAITSEVRAMFVGQHMRSIFNQCRLVMVPSRAAGYWSLYVWDIEEKMVHVFDPIMENADPEDIWAVHGGFVKKIGKAMTACKNVFFQEWEVDFEEFKDDFFRIEGATPDCSDSAMYIVHYMRWFDGKDITQPIRMSIVKHIRKTLPYELLVMQGNRGCVPHDLIESVDLTNS